LITTIDKLPSFAFLPVGVVAVLHSQQVQQFSRLLGQESWF
jgi:hypothetical protein